ncbi:MAG: hypothetical protein ACRDH2_09995 [Anaerolineales bacterium]
MSDFIRLEQTELVVGRSFTNLDQNIGDVATIAQMIHRLRLLLGEPSALPAEPRPLLLHLQEADGRLHRIVSCQPDGLRSRADLTWVGFFGQKRPELDPAPLDAMDKELMGELARYPGILSYSSLQLAAGNWGNLVLLASPEVKEHWRTSERHAYAAQEMAPRYYLAIRLHSGVLPGGLLSGQPAVIIRTKYYDFQTHEVWRALRELASA